VGGRRCSGCFAGRDIGDRATKTRGGGGEENGPGNKPEAAGKRGKKQKRERGTRFERKQKSRDKPGKGARQPGAEFRLGRPAGDTRGDDSNELSRGTAGGKKGNRGKTRRKKTENGRACWEREKQTGEQENKGG